MARKCLLSPQQIAEARRKLARKRISRARRRRRV